MRFYNNIKQLYYIYFSVRWYRFTTYIKSCFEILKLICSIGLIKYLNVYFSFLKLYKNLVSAYGKANVKRGCLDAFCETGTEGFIWMVYETGKSGYEGMVNLDEGDRLLIFLHNGTVAFHGFINQDEEAGTTPFPLNPDYGQPCAFGCWIHWTQNGWSVEDWASLFFHGVIYSDEHPRLCKGTDKVPYRAIVIKTTKEK